MLVGLNYLPLLLYAIMVSHKKVAQVEAQKEMQRKDRTRKQSIQQLIILVPFLVLVLSVMQRIETKK